MGGSNVLSCKEHLLQAGFLGPSFVVIFRRLAKADLRCCFDDPVHFTKQRQDHKILSIFFETLDHGCGLAAATRVVVNGNLWLHWFSFGECSLETA